MKNKKIYYFIVPLIIIIIWAILSNLKIISPLFLSTPQAVFLEIIRLFSSGEIINDILFTLYRTFIGFLIACIIGIPIGLLMGYYDKIYHSLEFIVEFFRSIPATALFPLFILSFGIGDSSKIALTAWAAGLILIINSMYGVHLGKELRIKSAKTMKISGFNLFKKIIFPEALPQIFSGMRIAISLSLVIVIVTEMFIGTNFGLGHRIINAQLVYRISEMYATILITGILGFLINKGFILVEKKIVHWRGK
ncbi:ABC transporter permease [Candidatus Woesearchaeota archaeon]|jgi:ABC-type nitrate/sulfonate/bicarbonate transport system permease component|nr:ABC transporter permease [Candidatus Woesearchaeota archaeon]